MQTSDQAGVSANYAGRVLTVIIGSMAVLAIMVLASPVAHAQDRGLGLGVIIGEPTGISGKLWLGEEHALDMGLGWSLGGYGVDKYDVSTNNDSRFHAHVDFLWHNYDIINTGERLPIYYGFGLRMNSGAGYDNSWGLRGVTGIVWVPRSMPIDIFIELTPVLQLNPSTRIGFNGGFGARYYLL